MFSFFKKRRLYRDFVRGFTDFKTEKLDFELTPGRGYVKKLLQAAPGEVVVRLPLQTGGELPFTQTLLSRHMYVQGSIGSGKTTLLKLILSDLMKRGKGKIIAFDPKGDFLRLARSSGVPYVVVSEDENLEPVGWNIFKEILGNEKPVLPEEPSFRRFMELNPAVAMRIRRVSKTLIWSCASMTSGEKQDPYFSHNAPASVFEGILGVTVMDALVKERGERSFFGRRLSELDNTIMAEVPFLSHEEMTMLLSNYHASSALEHIKADSGQTQGVLSFLKMYLSEVFSLSFSKRSEWCITSELHDPAFRVVLLEYRHDNEKVSLPIFTAILSTLFGEVLSTKLREKEIYVILDELHVLPKTDGFQTFLNMTRDLGGKVIAATQSVAQLYDKYGEQEAKAIISAFNTRVFLRTTDKLSLELVTETIGKLPIKKTETSYGATKTVQKTTEFRELSSRSMSTLPPGVGLFWTSGCEPVLCAFANRKKEEGGGR